MSFCRWAVVCFAFLCAMIVRAQFSLADAFVPTTLTNAQGETLPARVWHHYEKKDLPVRVLVLLHGSGECGTDNATQLNVFATFYRKVLVDLDAPPMMVIIPQCPKQSPWVRRLAMTEDYRAPRYPAPALRTVKEHLEQLIAEGIADPDRIMIGGFSLGAFGAWDAIQRWPEMFAAAIPICGGASVQLVEVQNAAKVSTWVFHGDQDTSVNVECSRRIVKALDEYGKRPRYTEFQGAGHAIWNRVFEMRDFYPWLYRQKRGKVETQVDPNSFKGKALSIFTF